MLVLSRKRNERIMIGDDIVLTVVSIRDGVVRIGVEAPEEIGVQRMTPEGWIEGANPKREERRP